MKPSPQGYEPRSHQALLDTMTADARWHSHGTRRPWDPARPDIADLPDHGRGLLDCFALGLHVLWTYHHAWGDEGFLATARLTSSVRRLLELIGYHPDPGFAALGLQHFQCKEGATATLPPGFRVIAKPEGTKGPATYETLRALEVSSTLNALQPFLPPPRRAASTAGAIAAAIGPKVPVPQVPLPPPFSGRHALVDSLRDRLAAARAGSFADHKAAMARQKALRVADVLSELEAQGAAEICGEAFEQLCEELCAAQSEANAAADTGATGPLSESQELLLGRLRAMAESQPTALDAFAAALARCEGESDEEWSLRLDQIAGFLDVLVSSILQEARDQVVRLRGPRVLSTLDRAYGPTGADLGVAAPGTDTLYVLPTLGRDGNPPSTHAALLRPGQWLVVGEDVEQVGSDGVSTFTRVHREAVQVLRVRDEVPPGWQEPATRVTFTPPLVRRYWLDRTVLLGNIAEITHGATVVHERQWSSTSGPTFPLPATPLTWRRAAEIEVGDGRMPDVDLSVAGQPWGRRPDLRGAAPHAPVFSVDLTPEGAAEIRVGDGREGTAVPDGAVVTVRARSGIGPDGNRDPGKIDAIAGANPAVIATFNPLPVSGGVNPEAPDLSKVRGFAGVHALGRAISVADVRSLALSFGSVRRAAVQRDALRRRDRLTVVVLGEGGAPLVADEQARLREFLVARMPPGASVEVVNGVHVPLRLRVVVRVQRGHDPLALMQAARVRLGVDSDPAGMPGLLTPGRPDLGEDVNLSDVYAALDGIPWLVSSLVTALHRASEPPARRDRIDVDANAVPVWDQGVPGVDAVAIAWEEAVDL